MAYIYSERNQTHLLPSSIEDYIAADDPVRAYDVFVEQIDLDRLGIRLDPDQVGHPEFDPRAMLKLGIWLFLRYPKLSETGTSHASQPELHLADRRS